MIGLGLEILTFGLLLSALWIGIFWVYRRYAVDLFRQQMFELRDGLFDEAAEGLIAFSHPAYGLLRRTMNAFLRLGHRVSFWHMLPLWFAAGRHLANEYSFKKRWDEATQGLEKTQYERLSFYRKKMGQLTVGQLLRRSPFLVSLIAVPFIVLILACILLFVLVAIGRTTYRIKEIRLKGIWNQKPKIIPKAAYWKEGSQRALNEIESTALVSAKVV